jgi:hypothetical protein
MNAFQHPNVLTHRIANILSYIFFHTIADILINVYYLPLSIIFEKPCK